LAGVIALTGLGTAAILSYALELTPGTSAGLLAGGLTSSPTLAAAQQAIQDGTISPPQGWTADQIVGNITTGYAITYIFGLAGLIVLIKLIPAALSIDLVQEAAKLEEEGSSRSGEAPVQFALRSYRITDPEITKAPLSELRQRISDDFATGAIIRNGEKIRLAPDQFLQQGDELFVLASVDVFARYAPLLGEETVPSEKLAGLAKTARIVVTKRGAVGKTLAELNLPRNYHVLLIQMRRMRLPVPLSSSFQLRKGDILTVVGSEQSIELLGEKLGPVDRDVAETDMLTFAFGIVLGVIVGMFSVSIAGVSVGLGSAGGLLTAGIVIGFLRNIRPVFGRLPDPASWILMELGLIIFMAGVGLRAGADIVQTFLQAGPQLVIAGVIVTTTPVLCGYFFGRKALNLNPVLLLGAITGAMTSGASLSIVTGATRSSIPALGYTGTYACANVLLTVAGSSILLI
jgi:putative transport protein